MNAPTPIQAVAAYLSPCVFLYRPSSRRPSSSDDTVIIEPPNPIKLILLAVWMDAREADMAKHLVRYQTLHPGATIVVVRSFSSYYFRPAAARRDLRIAASIIRGALLSSSVGTGEEAKATSVSLYDGQGGGSGPGFLVHVFPDGGSCMLYHLYQVWGEVYGDVFPPHITMFDSVPTAVGYRFPVFPVLFGVPKGWAGWLAFPKSYGASLGLWVKSQVPVVQAMAVDWGRAQWKVMKKAWETM